MKGIISVLLAFTSSHHFSTICLVCFALNQITKNVPSVYNNYDIRVSLMWKQVYASFNILIRTSTTTRNRVALHRYKNILNILKSSADMSGFCSHLQLFGKSKLAQCHFKITTLLLSVFCSQNITVIILILEGCLQSIHSTLLKVVDVFE